MATNLNHSITKPVIGYVSSLWQFKSNCREVVCGGWKQYDCHSRGFGEGGAYRVEGKSDMNLRE